MPASGAMPATASSASLARRLFVGPTSSSPQEKGADTSSAVEREDLLEMARKCESGAGDK